jgi:hypothetical protein
MRWPLPVLLGLLLFCLVQPAAAAAEANKIGYVSFQAARIELRDGTARVEVDYTLDPGMPLIILLFGSGDLQKKVERALNFPSAKADEVGLSRAVFTLTGASESYGDRAYWFAPHTFGVTFPDVEVKAPGFTMEYPKARAIPKGFGYFGGSP